MADFIADENGGMKEKGSEQVVNQAAPAEETKTEETAAETAAPAESDGEAEAKDESTETSEASSEETGEGTGESEEIAPSREAGKPLCPTDGAVAEVGE